MRKKYEMVNNEASIVADHRTKTRFINIAIIIMMLVFLLGENVGGVRAATTVTFTGQELLGRPTNNSITIDVIPNSAINLYYQYGLSSGSYTGQTDTVSAAANQPCNVIITGLSSNTQYYYRMQYQVPGDTGWVTRSEHSFWTQRSSGSTFTFDVTTDSHVNIMLGNATTWTETLDNVLADHPDFELDMGDTFAMDGVSTVANANSAYSYQRNTFFDLIGNTVPVYIVVGNHEQQEGWHLSDSADITLSPPVMGINAEKTYFLNPEPDGSFYTGNTDTSTSAISGNHLMDDYYAWSWGDALFVVIDPFAYTMTKPFSGNIGGGESGSTYSNDRWTWTLGQTQFNWLRQTLASSTAKYKFLFMHQEVGGNDSQLYGRGGAGVNLGEWGGYNEDGTTWGFDTKRSGWGGIPIQGLLQDYGVTAVFHGHDHEYAYETRGGVVYQEVPSAGFSGNGFAYYSTSNTYTDEVLPSPGNMRVTVTPSQVTVAYVDSSSGSVKYSYNISPSTNYSLTAGNDGNGSVTLNPPGGTYASGTKVTLTPVPNSGYTFSGWTGANSGDVQSSSGVYSITMNGNKTIQANFTASTTYTLAAGNDGHGTVTLSPSGGTYSSGTTVTLTPVPSTGYTFSSWSGTDSGSIINTSGVYTIVMNGNKTVQANFVVSTTNYTLTTQNDGNGSVTLSPTGGTYASGTTVTLTPVPNTGYQFSSWSGTDSGSIINTSGVYSIVMNGNKTVKANFSQITYTLTANNDGHGTVTLSPSGGTYSSGTTVTLTPVPNSGYQFSSWSGTNSGSIINTSGVYTIVMNANKTVQANFSQITYTLTANNDGHGTVTLSPTGGTYASGTTVTLTPVPNTGYQFSSWSGTDSGSIINTSGVYTIVMNGNKTVQANFSAVVTNYTLTAGNDGHGTVTLSPTGGTYASGTTVTLTPVPNSGYKFNNWSGTDSGSIVNTSGVYTIVMNGNKTVQANFIAYSSVSLLTGWNLVSFNIHPTSTAIADVLAGISGDYDLVYGWDASGTNSGSGNWIKYNPSVGYGNTLSTLDETMGFWIHMTTPATLTVTGTQPTSTNTSLLTGAGGWNLVGYPSTVSGTLPDILRGHGISNFTLVYAYHLSDTSDPWKMYNASGPGYNNDLTSMSAGWGYWVDVGAESIWSIGFVTP